MSACIIAVQVVMVPVALGRQSPGGAPRGRKPVFLVGFAVLPIRGLARPPERQTLTTSSGVQLLDGVGAGIFGVVSVLVVADLTKGDRSSSTSRRGPSATATGAGGPVSAIYWLWFRREGSRFRRRLRHARRDCRCRHALLRTGDARDDASRPAVPARFRRRHPDAARHRHNMRTP